MNTCSSKSRLSLYLILDAKIELYNRLGTSSDLFASNTTRTDRSLSGSLTYIGLQANDSQQRVELAHLGKQPVLDQSQIRIIAQPSPQLPVTIVFFE